MRSLLFAAVLVGMGAAVAGGQLLGTPVIDEPIVSAPPLGPTTRVAAGATATVPTPEGDTKFTCLATNAPTPEETATQLYLQPGEDFLVVKAGMEMHEGPDSVEQAVVCEGTARAHAAVVPFIDTVQAHTTGRHGEYRHIHSTKVCQSYHVRRRHVHESDGLRFIHIHGAFYHKHGDDRRDCGGEETFGEL